MDQLIVYAICVAASLSGFMYASVRLLTEPRISTLQAMAWLAWTIGFVMLATITGIGQHPYRAQLIIYARSALAVGGILLTTYFAICGTKLLSHYWRIIHARLQ